MNPSTAPAPDPLAVALAAALRTPTPDQKITRSGNLIAGTAENIAAALVDAVRSYWLDAAEVAATRLLLSEVRREQERDLHEQEVDALIQVLGEETAARLAAEAAHHMIVDAVAGMKTFTGDFNAAFNGGERP